ncbi:zinc finger protein 112-like [Oppia nitens]|uniref:zinc finger protein 112-like n=1 Tax=Oppia nitens TaxID=1686743 RepID=UPI0023DC1B05|nr:zinc finger protein 112-like [Oppia nitens]
MASNLVIVKDLFEELTEENQRLYDELKYCQQLIELFDKFRQLLDNYQTNCCCIENNELKTQFNELEDQYMKTVKKKIIRQSERQLICKSDVKNQVKKTRVKKIKSNKITTKLKEVKDQLSDNDINNNNEDKNETKFSDNQLTVQRVKRKYRKRQTRQTLKNVKQKQEKEEELDNNEDNDYKDFNETTMTTNVDQIDDNLVEEYVGKSSDLLMKLWVKRRYNRRNTKKNTNVEEFDATTESCDQQKRVKTFLCRWPGCGKVFRERLDLLAHLRVKHTKERPFKCDNCDKWFPVEHYLKMHRKSAHNPRPTVYKCRYEGCDKQFKQLLGLNEHHVRHERPHDFKREKTVECDVDGCDKRFTSVYGLRYHKQIVHTDDRPYPCEWPGCDKRFKDPSSLRHHRERHAGVRKYRCDIHGCDKGYTTYKGLEQHKRAHTRPYACSWPACDVRYACNNKLKEHMNAHQGIKPFSCHFQGCDVSYSMKASLRMHWRQTHKYIKTYHDKT